MSPGSVFSSGTTTCIKTDTLDFRLLCIPLADHLTGGKRIGPAMAGRRSSLGFLGMFGRSGDLRQLDAALRGADLHPALVPEGVKLTIVNLMKDHWPEEPPPQAYPRVANLFSYCIAGPETFERVQGPQQRLD